MSAWAKKPVVGATAVASLAAAERERQLAEAAALSDEDTRLRVVLDAGALISGAKLDAFGADVVYVTVPDVIAELRSEKTRAALAAFPFEIARRPVSEAALRAVARFAQATGDYHTLSRVDLRVLALAYMLEVEAHGETNLREAPAVVRVPGASPAAEAAAAAAASAALEQARKAAAAAADGPVAPVDAPISTATNNDGVYSGGGGGDDDDDDDDGNAADWITEDNWTQAHELPGSTVAPGADDDNDDDADDAEAAAERQELAEAEAAEAAAKEAAGGGGAAAAKAPTSRVVTVTTDYAMQNVLLQMGLRLCSVNGLSVTTLRHFFKRCHVCRWSTRDAAVEFCDSCGGHTMIRVHVWVDEQGVAHQRQSNRTIYNKRGTQYSIPRARGGRKARDLRLRPDDDLDGQLRRKQREKRGADIDPFRDAVEFGFAKAGPDGDGRARYGFGFHNRNENKRKTGNRKKKGR